jgi:hypothetical protein
VTTMAAGPATWHGGRPELSAPGPGTGRGGPSGDAPRDALRTVPVTRPPVPAGVAHGGSVVVAAADLAAVLRALGDGSAGHARHLGQPPVSAAHGRLARALAGAARDAPGQVPAVAGGAGETGPAAAVLAAIEALDGNHRRLLLDRLAATRPDVVEAGIQWLQEWQAEASERRRIRRNRDSKTRRDQRRATGDGNGG